MAIVQKLIQQQGEACQLPCLSVQPPAQWLLGIQGCGEDRCESDRAYERDRAELEGD